MYPIIHTHHRLQSNDRDNMMTSSNGNVSRVTGPLLEEIIGHQWIPLVNASDAELWCFLWSAPEQTLEHTIRTPVILDAIVLIMTSLKWNKAPTQRTW